MQNHDSRGSGQSSQSLAQQIDFVLVEFGENAHHDIGANDLRCFFLRLLRDGVHFHGSVLYAFSSLLIAHS
jgi:hypothetical protein